MFSVLAILITILAIVITVQNITRPTPTSISMPSQAPNNSSTIIPPTSTPTLSPTPTNTPRNKSESVLDFRYPNSIIISQNAKESIFESTDHPKKITDWYKNKIKAMNMSVTSFVQTSTNDNVLNKLVGADGNREVRVEINKNNNSQAVNISVNSSL